MTRRHHGHLYSTLFELVALAGFEGKPKPTICLSDKALADAWRAGFRNAKLYDDRADLVPVPSNKPITRPNKD